MIDTDEYEETDHPELVEFEGETLGDTLTNLLAEVKRLREVLITMRDECNDFNDLGKRLHDFMRKELIE